MKRINFLIQSLNYKKKLVLTCFLVGILPLVIMGIFCHTKTISLLLSQELNSMNSAISTAVDSIDSQISLYENLLTYLSCEESIVVTPTETVQGIYATYEQLNYKLDVFLNSIYAQHPEILQITIYNATTELTHGKQLRPISDLEQESWYDETAVTPHPSWHLNNDGTICVIQKLPNPYIKYVQSYSENCVSISFSSKQFFKSLDNISNNCHIAVASPEQTMYSYTSPSVSELSPDSSRWTTLSMDIDDYGWNIVLEKPKSILTAPADKMAVIIILIICACFAILLFMGNILSSFFVRRIDALHEKMQQVQQGDFNISIHDEWPDEIGELTNTFQEMINEINRLIQEDYKNKIVLRETQLKALQAQINPHFLYNCLSMINSKALMNDQTEISQLSQLLSVFYRTTLNKGKSETTLQDEIKNVKSYMNIQQLLHDNIFDVTYQIDEPLPEIEIPNLLLQPLVENSLVHGILPNKSRRGKIFLTISRVMEQVHFTILDNGLGIPRKKLDTLLQTDSGGYGLKNVHERLQLTYGETCGLTINSILDESTMITFSIPIQVS